MANASVNDSFSGANTLVYEPQLPGKSFYRAFSSSRSSNDERLLGIVETDFTIHRQLLNGAADVGQHTIPLIYMRVQTNPSPLFDNSTDNVTSVFASEYGKVEKQLVALANSSEQDRAVEKGAVDSAITVLQHLKTRQYAPPKLSWHGGDAVVMLWGLGGTTYAITVVEGEMGYVVRRNRRAVRMEDSISVNSLKLADRTADER